MNELCAVCGLTYGSHRGDVICHDQCPEHEGQMDWDMENVTTFVPSGVWGSIQPGTPRRR